MYKYGKFGRSFLSDHLKKKGYIEEVDQILNRVSVSNFPNAKRLISKIETDGLNPFFEI
jgi:hypothetical protein